MNEYTENLIKEVEELRIDLNDLFSGDFHVQEIFDLVKSLVEVAEAMFTDPGEGEAKKEVVLEAFDYYDEKYKLIATIDGLVKFPFYLKMLELADGKLIEWAIKNIIIEGVVWMLQQTVWRD